MAPPPWRPVSAATGALAYPATCPWLGASRGKGCPPSVQLQRRARTGLAQVVSAKRVCWQSTARYTKIYDILQAYGAF